MVGSKSLQNKLKSTPRMHATRSRLAVNSPQTQSIQNQHDDLIETIREIVKEELENQQEKIKEIVKLGLTTTNERLDKISKEVADLTESIEFTQEEVKDNKEDISQVQTNQQHIEDDMLNPDYVMEKLIELEDRSRCNNLRINGISEVSHETWEMCEDSVKDLIKTKLEINDEIEIDHCHRMGKCKDKKKTRSTVCRFLRFKDKQKILSNAKKLKNTGIFIYEDYCKETMDLQKSLWEEVLEHRQQNKIAYLNYRSVVVRECRDV